MKHPLHSICPYFAMFPEEFAAEQVERWTRPGDLVFDPFSGRGTTAFQSLLMGRRAAAMDINPVAFCISSAKADPPAAERVLLRIDELETEFGSVDAEAMAKERSALPEFFGRAFHSSTLAQVLFLRRELDWRGDATDRFVTALVLGSLHGDRDRSPNYFSNQMPRTISPKPAYSLRYWREHGLWPHKRDVFGILRQRASLRFRQPLPDVRGLVRLGDVRTAGELFSDLAGRVRLVVTSPPYYDVTNYEEDQWLRLWFLGGKPYPTYDEYGGDDRHRDKSEYWAFLAASWQAIAPLVQEDSVLVCRMGGRGMDESEITDGLAKTLGRAFAKTRLLTRPRSSEMRRRQTDLFRPGTRGRRYEWDYVFGLSG